MSKTATNQNKIRLLAYGDSPVVPSGFATVMKNVFKRLAQTGRYDIDIFGINDRGNYKDPIEHPYHIYQALPPGEQDPYGRSRFVDTVRGGGIDLQFNWDIIFILNDPFVLENPIPFFNVGTLPAVRDIQKTHYTKMPAKEWFKTVGYFPVDSPVKPHWVMSAISMVDMPVTYTHYGYDEIVKADMLLDAPTGIKPYIIPHGNDFADFHPLDKVVVDQFKKDFFAGQLRPETFLVIVVGRNQRRKDIPRAMKIFKEFQKRRPDSFLYVHAEEQESWGSLRETALQFGLRQGEDWNYPQEFIATKGFPSSILNGIYNAADVNLTATQGEGWGLPITEAMATKTINLAPAHTSIPELFNLKSVVQSSSSKRAQAGPRQMFGSPSTRDDELERLIKKPIRGIPINAGTTSSEWICHGSPDLERIRPLTNVDDGVQKLLWVYDHPSEVKAITRRAYTWLQHLDWDNVVRKWDKLFQQTYSDLQKERAHPDKIVKKWSKVIIKARQSSPNQNR